METVRASPKRSEGPEGRRWNRSRGVAGIANKQYYAVVVVVIKFSYEPVKLTVNV